MLKSHKLIPQDLQAPRAIRSDSLPTQKTAKDKKRKQLALGPRRVIKRWGVRQWRRSGLNNLMGSFMDDILLPRKLLVAQLNT